VCVPLIHICVQTVRRLVPIVAARVVNNSWPSAIYGVIVIVVQIFFLTYIRYTRVLIVSIGDHSHADKWVGRLVIVC
jgi:hypothetical protein